MDNMNCLACGSGDLVRYSHALYMSCALCRSIMQTDGIEKIDDYYNEQPLNFTHQLRNYRQYLKIISRMFNTENYSLIDVGAGDGSFLAAAKPYFGTVKGYDVSLIAQERLQNAGYFIEPGELPKIQGKVVTAFQVLEHQSNPRKFISSLGCGSSDWLVITAPAADSPTSLRHWSTGAWRSLSPSHHLCLYTRIGLERLLQDLGFSLRHYEFVWSSGHNYLHNSIWYAGSCLKWPIKMLAGRKRPFPRYVGKNSFLAVAQLQSSK